MVNDISKKNLKGRRKACIAPFCQLTINWDGSVGFCCTDYNHLINVGKIPDNSLLEIWQGKQLRQMRIFFRKAQFEKLPKICRDCESTFYISNPDYKMATFITNKPFEAQAKVYLWLRR